MAERMPPGEWTTDPGDDDALLAAGLGIDAIGLYAAGRQLRVKAALVVVVTEDDHMGTCVPAGQEPALTMDLALNVLEGGGARVAVIPVPPGQG